MCISLKRLTDEEINERVRQIKDRLIQLYGYNEQSATDVLEHVAAMLARGE